jgi:hypothetical protein
MEGPLQPGHPAIERGPLLDELRMPLLRSANPLETAARVARIPARAAEAQAIFAG